MMFNGRVNVSLWSYSILYCSSRGPHSNLLTVTNIQWCSGCKIIRSLDLRTAQKAFYQTLTLREKKKKRATPTLLLLWESEKEKFPRSDQVRKLHDVVHLWASYANVCLKCDGTCGPLEKLWCVLITIFVSRIYFFLFHGHGCFAWMYVSVPRVWGASRGQKGASGSLKRS